MQALANTSSHVAARLAGLLLESPDLSALDLVCIYSYPTNVDNVHTFIFDKVIQMFQVPQIIEKIRRIESRVANDQVLKKRENTLIDATVQELKLADTLRFHMRDTAAAKDLLYRRLKALAAFEAANKELDLARSRNRDREVAETRQREAWTVFEGVSNFTLHIEMLGPQKIDEWNCIFLQGDRGSQSGD